MGRIIVLAVFGAWLGTTDNNWIIIKKTAFGCHIYIRFGDGTSAIKNTSPPTTGCTSGPSEIQRLRYASPSGEMRYETRATFEDL